MIISSGIMICVLWFQIKWIMQFLCAPIKSRYLTTHTQITRNGGNSQIEEKKAKCFQFTWICLIMREKNVYHLLRQDLQALPALMSFIR